MAAGVGKGTIFRRFGNKAGLAVALLDTRERELQEAILHGPPPLGPGAGSAARLTAFAGATWTTCWSTWSWCGCRRPRRLAPVTGSGRTGLAPACCDFAQRRP